MGNRIQNVKENHHDRLESLHPGLVEKFPSYNYISLKIKKAIVFENRNVAS